MIPVIDPASLQTQAEELFPALKNPAVAHCCDVWERVHAGGLKKKNGGALALYDANSAFQHAIPPLVGYENICDFIACVGYGMLTGKILEASGTRLLYAAQVALSTVAPQSRKQARSPA
ncbi:MAG: hypothetical protein ABSG96_10150 [Terracidiphilus sp.]|jgi:hypothetical protein